MKVKKWSPCCVLYIRLLLYLLTRCNSKNYTLPTEASQTTCGGFVACMEILQTGLSSKQVYQLVVRASLISKVYGEIRRAKHEVYHATLRNDLASKQLRFKWTDEDVAKRIKLIENFSRAFSQQKRLCTIVSSLHERMLIQQLQETVEIYAPLDSTKSVTNLSE